MCIRDSAEILPVLLLYSQYLQYTPPKRRFCSLPLMCFFLGGNTSSNNRYVNVRDRSYREYSQYSGFCTADTVCTSSILRFDPANKYCRYSQQCGRAPPELAVPWSTVLWLLPDVFAVTLLLRVLLTVQTYLKSAPSALSQNEAHCEHLCNLEAYTTRALQQ